MCAERWQKKNKVSSVVAVIDSCEDEGFNFFFFLLAGFSSVVIFLSGSLCTAKKDSSIIQSDALPQLRRGREN